VLLLSLAGGGAWLYTPDLPRATLEARYHVAPTDYVDADGVRLHARDTGKRDGRVLILLHGFGSSLDTWDAWAALLDPDYRVIRFDLPGFGLTGADPSGDYTDARDMAVLAALMDRLGVAHATLIGNSMGGKLAWMFAATNPARVDALVLISPDGFASPGFEYERKPDTPAIMKILPYVLPRAMLRMSLAPAYGNPNALTEARVDRYRDMMLAPGVRPAILARMGQVLLHDPVPMLRRIAAPTLLLWGEQDGMIPFSNGKDYLSAIPHATLAALPGLGHVPMEEAPEVSLAPVRAFLARTEPHPAAP
jgi:pimeloyl-ACP methyl ester carboxylesterase